MRLLFLIVALLLSASAFAQKKPQLSVEVIVGSNDDDAGKCGISKEVLEPILALTLRNNGIEVTTERTNPYLLFRVGVLKLIQNECTFSLDASIRGTRPSDRAQAPLGAFKPRGWPHTELCSAGYIGISPKPGVVAFLLREAETATKVCLGTLNY